MKKKEKNDKNFKIYVAPMAGITDYPFRKILKKQNPDLIFTEMINAKLFLENDKETLNSLLKVDNFDNEATQVFGNNHDDIVNSFIKLENLGFKKINLNMGCPQPKIIKNFSGSALLPKVDFVENLLIDLKRKLNEKTKISIKIRIGFKDFSNPEIYLDLASKYNLDFICIHGRTQEQMYGGNANWDIVKKLSFLDRNTNFIGNGDLFEPKDIYNKVKECNLDGIMLARGIIGNPWLISQTREYLTSKKIITIPSFEEVKETLLEHLEYLIENKGEKRASLEINKFIKPYFNNFLDDKVSENLNLIIREKDISEKINKINKI